MWVRPIYFSRCDWRSGRLGQASSRRRCAASFVVGIVVGMAYVVGRRDGRFEIRESLQSAKGPRARTLANFAVLSENVLHLAEARASRPFDREAVQASAVRRGVPLDRDLWLPSSRSARHRSSAGFVEASRRFATVAAEIPERQRPDSGVALVDLINFAEEVARHQPPRSVEPLRFPPLANLVAARRAS